MAESQGGMIRARWAMLQRSMWPLAVVVGAVPGEDDPQVPLTKDQDSVGELGSGGPTKRSAKQFARGQRGGIFSPRLRGLDRAGSSGLSRLLPGRSATAAACVTVIVVAGRERERLLTTEEAAKAIGVSRSTLIRYAERNYVTPAQVLPSGHRRWRLADLQRQLAQVPSRGERDDQS